MSHHGQSSAGGVSCDLWLECSEVQSLKPHDILTALDWGGMACCIGCCPFSGNMEYIVF